MLKSKKIVALILAAGESNRLGKPKQLLPFGKTTMLNHIKEHLTLNFVEQTFIVLGAYAKKIKETANLSSSEIIVFEGWEEGMGSSLSFACSKILTQNNYDGILITLSDIPLVNKEDYRKMFELFYSSEDIVATKVYGSLGVPAIFGRDYFDELMHIKGAKGAKPLIQKYISKVKVIHNDRAGVDIDTLKDYSSIQKHSG